MTEDALWDDLRQGARNVAGVSWQINVCVYLIVASRAGHLPFADLVPEGFEDADCHSADGSRTFVQMKELDAGDGQMSAAAIADALAHAEASARGCQVVLVTDGTLASQLRFTGWEARLDSQDGRGRDRIVAGLVQRGHTLTQAEKLLQRSRLVRLPYRVRQESESLLAEALTIHPAVAGIVVDRLTQMITKASADQRRTTASSAARIRVSDIDAVAAEVQETVDVAGLDAAVADGVCSPVSFAQDTEPSASTFYLGVDGEPGHVAADLDVMRPDELAACAEGLRKESSVLLVGPSGSGKSVLLWRAARDLVSSARVVRVRRLLDAHDAVSLARHVRLLRPSETSPVLVVADNLGRPAMTAWTTAAPMLRELTHVMLLGAARSEDFSPTLFVGATRVVEPRLSVEVAHLVSTRMAQLGIAARMVPDEAFERSQGLLMEYIALLSTGQRLRQVLSAQVAALSDPPRHLQREAARLVATAHTLGLSLPASRLATVLADTNNPMAIARIGDALAVLRDEHLVVQDGDRWRGLHELRSSTLSELLHDNPPPSIQDSVTRLSAVIDPGHAGWMLRRVGEQFPESVTDVATALAQRISEDMSVREVAALLEGAERADNALYVHEVLPILENRRPDGMTLGNLAFLAYPLRNQGQRFDQTGNETWDTGMRRVSAIAATLPARSAFTTTVSNLCEQLDPGRLTTMLASADLLDVLRVLEAGSRWLRVPLEAVHGLAARMQHPTDLGSALLWSRLVAATSRYLTPAQMVDVWRTPAERVEVLCRADPLALTVEVDSASVHVTRMLSPDGVGEMPPLLPWDVLRPGATEALNETTVACLQRIKEACPELERFELTTVMANGQPYRIADHEPGHKNMPRENFPDREDLRHSVGFQAGLRRATSSQTWTEIATSQISIAAALTQAAQELPLRFKTPDNARRRTEWRSKLSALRRKLSDIKPPPLMDGAGPDSVMGLSDYADRDEDATTRALSQALEAIDRSCGPAGGGHSRAMAAAMDLRDAADQLAAARERASASFHGLGDVLPEALIHAMRCSADLAAALHAEPGMSRRICAEDPLGTSTQIWRDVAGSRAAECASALAHALGPLQLQSPFIFVEDPTPVSWSLLGGCWIVLTPLELLDEVLTALGALDDDTRERLEKVVILPVAPEDNDSRPVSTPANDALVGTGTSPAADRGSETPAESTASVAPPDSGRRPHNHDDALWPFLEGNRYLSLGLGIQLASHASGPGLPLSAERVEQLACAANLTPARAGARVADIVQSLLARSHEAARRKLRQLPEPMTSEETPVTSRRTRAADADKPGPERCDTAVEQLRMANDESARALAHLQQQVEDEEAGLTDQHLVEIVTRGVRGEPLDERAIVIMEAMAVLHVANLQPTAHTEMSQSCNPQ